MSSIKLNQYRTIGESLAVLDANAGHLSQTARVLNLPKSTLKSWRDNYASDEAVARYRSIKNQELAEGFRVVSGLAVERLIAEMNSVDVNKLATVMAIGVDKQLMLSAEPPTINQYVDSEDIVRTLDKLMTVHFEES